MVSRATSFVRAARAPSCVQPSTIETNVLRQPIARYADTEFLRGVAGLSRVAQDRA